MAVIPVKIIRRRRLPILSPKMPTKKAKTAPPATPALKKAPTWIIVNPISARYMPSNMAMKA